MNPSLRTKCMILMGFAINIAFSHLAFSVRNNRVHVPQGVEIITEFWMGNGHFLIPLGLTLLFIGYGKSWPKLLFLGVLITPFVSLYTLIKLTFL